MFVCLFAFRCFSLSIDRETGVETDYTDALYFYPAEQGKRSPLISNPSFQSILILICAFDSNASFAIELPIDA
jgi:hypothetical protein